MLDECHEELERLISLYYDEDFTLMDESSVIDDYAVAVEVFECMQDQDFEEDFDRRDFIMMDDMISQMQRFICWIENGRPGDYGDFDGYGLC